MKQSTPETKMQADTLEIRPDIRAGLHALAEETHREEADMLNEALAAYLANERWAIARLREGLAQADRGEFVSDEDMEAFFSRHDT
jgi:predicted transcriptional regulator